MVLDGELTSGARNNPVSRRQRNREEMIRVILEASREVMREQGVAALNMHEVARRVGIKAPSLYEYFPNRAAIYDELFRVGVRAFAEHQAREMASTSGAWERIEASIRSYMSFAQLHPELWYLLFERPVPGFTPSERSMEESRVVLQQATSYMAEAVAVGEIHPGASVEEARDVVIAMIHGLTASHLANEPHLPIGSGRFGSLIPIVMRLLHAAWDVNPSEPPK